MQNTLHVEGVDMQQKEFQQVIRIRQKASKKKNENVQNTEIQY